MLFAIPGTVAILTIECESYSAILNGHLLHMGFSARAGRATHVCALIHRNRQTPQPNARGFEISTLAIVSAFPLSNSEQLQTFFKTEEKVSIRFSLEN